MARIFFASLLLIALFVQIAVMPTIEPFRVLPSVPLVLLLVWSSIRGIREGLFWAFGLGLFYDILALDPMGSNGLAFMVVALLGGIGRPPLFQQQTGVSGVPGDRRDCPSWRRHVDRA